MRKTSLATLTIVALVVALAGPASADLIAVNFEFQHDVHTISGDTDPRLGPAHTGAAGYTNAILNNEAGTTWNTVRGTSSTAYTVAGLTGTTWNNIQAVNLTTGGATTMTLGGGYGKNGTWGTVANLTGYRDGASGTTSYNGPNCVLNNDVMRDNMTMSWVTPGSSVGFRVNGFAAGNYDVYVVSFALGGTADATIYTYDTAVSTSDVWSVPTTYQVDNRNDEGASGNAAPTAWLASTANGTDGNYVRLSVAVNSPTDYIRIFSMCSAQNAGSLNAIQIVQTSERKLQLNAPVSGASVFLGGSASLTASAQNIGGYTGLTYTVGAAGAGLTVTAGSSFSGTLSGTGTDNMATTVQGDALGAKTLTWTTSATNGSNAPLPTTSATVSVYEHSAAEFFGDDTTLTLEFGNAIPLGSLAQQSFAIENLAATLADYRVDLGLDSTSPFSGDTGKFNVGTPSFSNLAAGTPSSFFDVFLDTSAAGEFTAVYHLGLSDDSAISGAQSAGAQTLTLTLHGTVVPEPATLGFLALGGLSMLGAAIRRRRAA